MKTSILKMAALALSVIIATQANAANDIYNRSAVGDITVKGGASRIHGDMNTMYESEIKLAKKAHAKNVILLIVLFYLIALWLNYLKLKDKKLFFVVP